MPLAKGLNLEHILLHAPEMGADPMPFFKAAQQVHPWLAHCDQGLLVTQYQAIKIAINCKINCEMSGEINEDYNSHIYNQRYGAIDATGLWIR